MKRIKLILIGFFVALVFVASITTIVTLFTTEKVVHNYFMVVGDYTFEVLNGPDEYGDLNVRIRNTKDSLFTYTQYYNDADASKRLCYGDLSVASIHNARQRTITIHKTSGLFIYPNHEKNVSGYREVPIGTTYDLKKGEFKVFESASNFFGIY